MRKILTSEKYWKIIRLFRQPNRKTSEGRIHDLETRSVKIAWSKQQKKFFLIYSQKLFISSMTERETAIPTESWCHDLPQPSASLGSQASLCTQGGLRTWAENLPMWDCLTEHHVLLPCPWLAHTCATQGSSRSCVTISKDQTACHWNLRREGEERARSPPFFLQIWWNA